MTRLGPPSPHPAAPAVLIRVQHHPDRAALLPRLLPPLAGCEVEVVTDPDPDGRYRSAWRTYRECLARPHQASHVLVLQDDAVPLPKLGQALPSIVAAHPGSLIGLFLAGSPPRSVMLARRAAKAGERFAQMHGMDFMPTVATVWPADTARRFLRWTDTITLPDRQVADDALVGRFVRAYREPAVVTVPSVVQHPDDHPSLIGRRARAGKNPMRVAAIWQPDFDPCAVAWAT